jgi:hypothetical protein
MTTCATVNAESKGRVCRITKAVFEPIVIEELLECMLIVATI